MKCAIWNVNSIKARKDHVLKWLEEESPHILMIQELKGTEFPEKDFETIGYKSHVKGQKAYNGVATLFKNTLDVVKHSDVLEGDDLDEQARFLETEVDGVTFINIYLPNGNPAGTEKYDYKLSWMDRLYERAKTLREKRVNFLIGGDFNVIPENRDCYDPKAWEGDALFLPTTREKFEKIKNLGLYDAFRMLNNESGQYSFWDYQAGCWPQNKGIRIDHFLVSPAIADKVSSCRIDAGPRAWEKPSDHTPVILEFEDVIL
ncbi:MAG: exodeoxyribonuclease III [Alphaproteobacteria bacterium]|nr:exodeoxyribonuclease III [Alphaproteobacteria bacterium]